MNHTQFIHWLVWKWKWTNEKKNSKLINIAVYQNEINLRNRFLFRFKRFHYHQSNIFFIFFLFLIYFYSSTLNATYYFSLCFLCVYEKAIISSLILILSTLFIIIIIITYEILGHEKPDYAPWKYFVVNNLTVLLLWNMLFFCFGFLFVCSLHVSVAIHYLNIK